MEPLPGERSTQLRHRIASPSLFALLRFVIYVSSSFQRTSSLIKRLGGEEVQPVGSAEGSVAGLWFSQRFRLRVGGVSLLRGAFWKAREGAFSIRDLVLERAGALM